MPAEQGDRKAVLPDLLDIVVMPTRPIPASTTTSLASPTHGRRLPQASVAGFTGTPTEKADIAPG